MEKIEREGFFSSKALFKFINQTSVTQSFLGASTCTILMTKVWHKVTVRQHHPYILSNTLWYTYHTWQPLVPFSTSFKGTASHACTPFKMLLESSAPLNYPTLTQTTQNLTRVDQPFYVWLRPIILTIFGRLGSCFFIHLMKCNHLFTWWGTPFLFQRSNNKKVRYKNNKNVK